MSMDKQKLLEWVQSLPDNLEALPFELSEIEEQHSDWERVPGATGRVFPTVYQQRVETNLILKLRFTGKVLGEFQRDQFNNPSWVNLRRVHN
jgi:hypothetical protein